MRKSSWLPRAKFLRSHGSNLFIARLGGYGFDYLGGKGFSLYQFGYSKRKTDAINFICKLPKSTRPPTFLFSIDWHTKGKLLGYVYGKTTKPVNIYNIWRTTCQPASDQKKNMNMTNKTNSGNGSITLIQG